MPLERLEQLGLLRNKLAKKQRIDLTILIRLSYMQKEKG